ncbi:MAG TPA: ankyrin repeat domain-containing protein [Pyrinomonadaceae bacterium]|nr:ankyrin repeat domain-containing protein [Pyrinomonadaceae bacterium]
MKDTSGKAVDDATVTFDTIKTKTDKDGVAKASHLSWYDQRRYDLQVSKAGYLTSEHVLFRYCSQSYSIHIRESFPDSAPDRTNFNAIPITIRLLKNPVTKAERRSVEAEKRKRQFLLAAKRGDAASLRKLLDAGVTPHTADDNGVPAIVWAAFGGDADTIKTLLDRGAVVSKKNTLAHQALLIYLTDGVRNDKRYVEYQAAAPQREEGVRRLVEAGAGLNIQGSYRGTVLNNAIQLTRYGDQTALASTSYSLPVESIKTLLTAGANVNAPDIRWQTPLMSAAAHLSVGLIKMLLDAGARPSINAKDKEGRTALMFAAERGNAEAIKMLLQAGAAINDKDAHGQTPLMYARGHRYTGISSLAAGKTLIAAGASVNVVSDPGQTPLMMAVQRHYVDEVKMFLAAGASANAKDNQGRTALMYVKSELYDDASPELVRVLLAAGADVNVVDNDGATPLILLTSQNFSEMAIVALLREGARTSINAQDQQGRTALMIATQNGYAERLISHLLKAGADPNKKDKAGRTALMYVIECRVCGSEDQIAGRVRVLLEGGADVRIKDDQGRTARMLAQQIGLKSVIELLEQAERRR